MYIKSESGREKAMAWPPTTNKNKNDYGQTMINQRCVNAAYSLMLLDAVREWHRDQEIKSKTEEEEDEEGEEERKGEERKGE